MFYVGRRPLKPEFALSLANLLPGFIADGKRHLFFSSSVTDNAKSVTIAPDASTENPMHTAFGSLSHSFPDSGCSQKKYPTASKPNMALDMRLDLSCIEPNHPSYVQNCLWNMNSNRYEAPSSNAVVTTAENMNTKTGCLSRSPSIASSIKAPTA